MAYIEYKLTESILNQIPPWLSLKTDKHDPFRMFLNYSISDQESSLVDQEEWLKKSLFPPTCAPDEPSYYYVCFDSGIYKTHLTTMLATGVYSSYVNNSGVYFYPEVGVTPGQVTVYKKENVNDFLTNVPTRIEFNSAWYLMPTNESGILGVSYSADTATTSGVLLVSYADSQLSEETVRYYNPERQTDAAVQNSCTLFGNFPCWYRTQSFVAAGKDEFLTLENILGTGIYFDFYLKAAYAQTATLENKNIVPVTLKVFDYINIDGSGVARLVPADDYTSHSESGIIYFPTGIRPSYGASGSSNYEIDPGWNSNYFAEYNYYLINDIADITNKGKFFHCPSQSSGLLISGSNNTNEVEIPYWEALASRESGVVSSGDLILYTQPKYLIPGTNVNCIFNYANYLETAIVYGDTVSYDVASGDAFAYFVDSSGVIIYPSGSPSSIHMLNKYTTSVEVSGGNPNTTIYITYPSGSPESDDYYSVSGVLTPRPLLARVHYTGRYEINDIVTTQAVLASGSPSYYDYDIDNTYTEESAVVPRTLMHIQASGTYPYLRYFNKLTSTVNFEKNYGSIAYNPKENIVYLLDKENRKLEGYRDGNKLFEDVIDVNYNKQYLLPTSQVFTGIDFNPSNVVSLGAIGYCDNLIYITYTDSNGLSHIVGSPPNKLFSRLGTDYGTTSIMTLPDLPTSICFDKFGNLLVAANYKLYKDAVFTPPGTETILEFKKYFDYYTIQNKKFIFREKYDSTEAGIPKYEETWNIVDEHLLLYGLSRFTGETNIDALNRLSKRIHGTSDSLWGTSVQGLTNAVNNEFGFDSFNMTNKNVFFLSESPLKYDPVSGQELGISVSVNGSGLATRFFEYTSLPLGWEFPSGCSFTNTYFDKNGEATAFYGGWVMWHNSDGDYSRILELSASGIATSGILSVDYYRLNNREVAEAITDTSNIENPYDTFYVYKTAQRDVEKVNVYTLTHDYVNSNLMASGVPTAEFLRLAEQTRTVASLLYGDAMYEKTPYDSLDVIKFGYDSMPTNFDIL